MEYLMTYGWAILIIAVVLGVLFQLGIFSGSALTPKAQPGSCQVQRLLGQVSLEGECQGQLPQFVGQFNGASGYINVGNAADLSLSSTGTFTLWINPSSSWQSFAVFMDKSGAGTDVSYRIQRAGTFSSYEMFDGSNSPTGGNLKTGSWFFISVVINNGFATGYINNTVVFGPSAIDNPLQSTTAPVLIGTYSGLGAYFGGLISNVQIYNTSLSANEVKALYLEGIGGAPVKIQNLVGWWPLNGDAKDYSGNNNNGAISGGVSFNSTWNSQYTPP